MRGDVTIEARCAMPERLIERATAQGARLEAVRRPDGRTLVVECDPASARRLLALCRRFSIPARVTRRRGGSALARFARRRRTLPVGLAAAVALSCAFLSRLWLIDLSFSGETASLGDAAALARSVEALGIRPGIARNVDPGLLAQRLQAQGGAYSYVGARIQGVRLLVEAVPESPAPPLYDVDAARDLVCLRDGIVARAVAQSGELCVKPGDAVRRGQLLIRGEERSGQEETRPIAALGEVVLRTWFEGEAELPLVEARTEATGRRSTQVSLETPFLQWPIAAGESYPQQREVRQYLPIGGLFVPVEIARVHRIETRRIEAQADLDALKARAGALALAEASRRLALEGPADYQEGRVWIDYEITGGALRARAVHEIQFNAAVTREALQGG